MIARSTDDNIAISIETAADLAGSRAARADITALGKETAVAMEQANAATAKAAAGEKSLAAETAKAATEQGKLVATVEQSRAAWARSGGDMSKFAAELQKLAGAEQQAATATDRLTTATEVETVATDAATAADARRLRQMGLLEVAAIREAEVRQLSAQADVQRMGQLQTAAIAEDAMRTKRTNALAQEGNAITAISPKARSSANSLGILAMAVTSGSGSMAGMATAAGSLAFGLAAMTNSARIAAGASGIGALVVVGTLAFEVFRKLNAEGKASTVALSHIGGMSLSQAQASLAQERARLKVLQDQAAVAHSLGGQTLAGIALDPMGAVRKQALEIASQKALEEQVAKVKALTEATIKLGQAEDRRRHEFLLGVADELKAQDSALHLEQLRTGNAMKGAFIGAAGGRTFSVTNDFDLQREALKERLRLGALEIEQQFRLQDELGAIRDLTGAELAARKLLLDANTAIGRELSLQITAHQALAVGQARIGLSGASGDPVERLNSRLASIELERLAEIQKTGDITNANLRAEQLIRAARKQSFNESMSSLARSAEAHRQHSGLLGEMARTAADAVRRYEIAAQAVKDAQSAKSEGAAALKAAASGNFAGAALHGAAAIAYGAAAAFGGAEALGGGGGGGGGGGSAGGGGGGLAGDYGRSPREYGGGSQTIVLQLINPNDIEEISWQLERRGVLKTPISAPRSRSRMQARDPMVYDG